jgi:hypothetical protein
VGNLGYFLPIVGVVAVVGIGGVVGSSRRKRAARELAAAKRWDLQKRDTDLPKTFGGHPFGEGHSRVAERVMRGPHSDHRVLVFDYRYKTPGGDGDDTHRYWIACVDDLPGALPVIEVAIRKKLKGRAGRWNGVEFRSGDPAFDERYRVLASSPRLAADLLDPAVVRLLTSWPDLPWRIEGNRLITWGKGVVKPHWIEPTLNMLCTLADTIPDEVWRNAQGF